MKFFAQFFLVIGLALLTTSVVAQEMEKPRDSGYDKISIKDKKIIPYDHIREADVFWEKKVWRVVDVREKMNLPFKYPKQPLVKIMRDAAAEGSITVYKNDEFTEVYTPTEAAERGVGEPDTIEVVDPITLKTTTEIQSNDFDPQKVTQFRIKEQWIFDEESAQLVVRILGVAPILDVYDDQGLYRGTQVLFWIYYPEARQLLANYEVFNPMNDAMQLSWEDIFEMRYFASYIIKERNVYDRRIEDYATGMDALWEAERIENEIFNFEHDLWSY